MKYKYCAASHYGLILVLILSLGFIFNTFSWMFITGHSGFWLVKNNDLTQHLSGLNMYLVSEWKFPLLAFDGLNYPQGTSVTFVDGIPIFALLLKIFLPRHIGYISPFGYWLVLSFMLQAVSAWWIMRELAVKSWAFLIFLTCIFLTYPALLDRIRHIALMSHWIILFAIALYLRGHRLQRLPIVGWIALFFFSFYIHVYFFAMVFGIYLAAVLEARHKLTIGYIFSLISPLITLGMSLFIFLLPLPEGMKSETGFDALAMDIFSPFYGGKFIQWQVDLSSHQDGFNYLGLGIIFIFTWVMFSQFSKNRKSIKKHWALFTIMMMYFVYSLSDKIYFGGKLIAIVDYPDCLSFITNQLRASGRFFWPVGYLIIIYSFYQLYQKINKKYVFSFLTIILLFIQLNDINEIYKKLQIKGHRVALLSNPYFSLDQILDKKVQVIYLYPPLVGYDYSIQVVIPIMQYAAMREIKLNTGFIARYGIHHDNISAEVKNSVKSTSVYLFSKYFYTNITQVYKAVGNKNIICQHLDIGFVCQIE